ncbi:TPA: hypothetical protein PCO64_000824 [Klebsiella aerogenes]|nr:hypothetical protein [Klebsiella aerogenes]
MIDLTRLLASLKRRSAHAKEFGDSITFVKLEDLDALIEAVELKEEQRANWFQMAQKLGEDLDAAEKRIAELEEAQSMHESDTLMLCRQFDELAAAMGWSSELAMQQGVSQLEYARSLKERIADLESRTVTVKLPPLNNDLISILGRPNFMCAHLAELLRKSGEDIKRKSEHEQAAVIHWFLGIYLEHGDKWEGVVKSDMQARAAGIKWEAE